MPATNKLPSSPLPNKLTMTSQLLLDLFNSQPNALLGPFEQWVITSKPFAAFVQEHQRKIRKKIRVSRDIEEMYNLYCELRTAYLLLQEPKFAVAYEPYAKEPRRSSDFAVTYRTHTTFHVEVTRLRVSQQEQQLYQQEAAPAASNLEVQTGFIQRHESRRLVDVICDKFKQLSPGIANVLWVWSESRVMHELDVGQLMHDLKRKAEQRDADLFSRCNFEKPADFMRYYQRLSLILIQDLHDPGANGSPRWWQNNDARHLLPPRAANLLRSLISTDASLHFTT